MAIVYEEPPTYTDHDRLFKELIQTFFKEFVEAFFPEQYPYIDFLHTTFLSQEIFTDILKGKKREVDILVETKLKGEETLIIIHVEPQSNVQKEFHERMFIYFSRLYEKYRKPILPIAVFSYNGGREIPDTFTISIPTHKILHFHYLHLHLVNINWRTFLEKDNPVSTALLSKMGYRKEERVQVKFEFLRMLSRMKLDPAKTELLIGFFDTYLPLNEEEESQMREKITSLPEEEAKEVLKLPNSYFERGIGKGMEKGIETVVYEMHKKGFPEDIFADITKLTEDTVREIKLKMDSLS